ncbi:MAG: hypothetical protein K6A23_13880 [Butyrivibrio sp.]|nr:hypothetical protein [Butyrivibrio sp.]
MGKQRKSDLGLSLTWNIRGKCCMLGGLSMDVTVETTELLEELDKGIDDMENGRVTPHEDTMKILMQRYDDYVSQNP